jgi:predicted Fe-Mo cluster-binding NifX family protein
MTRKLLITLWNSNVAPRFDHSPEVIVVTFKADRSVENTKSIVLAHPSTDELCNLILKEDIDTVICGGIELEILEYLTWKKVRVIDSVMGPWDRILDYFKSESLKPGAILFDRPERIFHGK